MNEKFLTLKQALRLAGIARPTIFKYLKNGTLTRYKQRGRLYLDRSEVEKLNSPQKETA